jgi:hypothetical protein
MKKEFVCRGLINRQLNERLRLEIQVVGDTSEIAVDTLAIDARLVNEIMLKPE